MRKKTTTTTLGILAAAVLASVGCASGTAPDQHLPLGVFNPQSELVATYNPWTGEFKLLTPAQESLILMHHDDVLGTIDPQTGILLVSLTKNLNQTQLATVNAAGRATPLDVGFKPGEATAYVGGCGGVGPDQCAGMGGSWTCDSCWLWCTGCQCEGVYCRY